MNEIRELLRDGDPLAGEPSLSAADVQRMRHTVLSGATSRPSSWWPQPILVAATIALTLTASVALGRRLLRPPESARDGRAAPLVPDSGPHVPARRQLQFATPGGTRIIWVFNSDFTL